MEQRNEDPDEETLESRTLRIIKSDDCFFLRVLSLLSAVVENGSSRRLSSGCSGVHLYIQNRSCFTPNPFVSPQFVEDSHKNGILHFLQLQRSNI